MSCDRGSIQAASITVIIVDRVMHRVAVVPDCEAAGAPPEAAGELGAGAMPI